MATAQMNFAKDFLSIFSSCLSYSFLRPHALLLSESWNYAGSNRKRITELTGYLERVNTGAGGTLIQTQEDDFSHLQDKIYKTVTALWQTREAAVSAKMNFAENLANIAHQLKTPVTAAFLSLQLLKKETCSDYVNQAERQLERLNRLVLSRFQITAVWNFPAIRNGPWKP